MVPGQGATKQHAEERAAEDDHERDQRHCQGTHGLPSSYDRAFDCHLPEVPSISRGIFGLSLEDSSACASLAELLTEARISGFFRESGVERPRNSQAASHRCIEIDGRLLTH
jgi:hypothetical protein